MSKTLEKIKENPIGTTFHGLTAGAIVWMFSTFGTKDLQEELRARVRVLEKENTALVSRIEGQKEVLIYFTQKSIGIDPEEYARQSALYE